MVYRQNFYSAPWRLIGQSVAVRVTEDELVIHDRAFVEAARHRLFPRTAAGQRSHCKDHEPPRDAQRRSRAARGALRGVRRDGHAVPGGPARRATGPARTRPSASCRWRRPTRVPTSWRRWSGRCGTAPSALQAIATHPRGAGPAQDAAGRAGRRPSELPRPARRRRADTAATHFRLPSPAGRGPSRCRTDRPRAPERATRRGTRRPGRRPHRASMVTSPRRCGRWASR